MKSNLSVKALVCWLLAAALILGPAGPSKASAWQWRNPLPQGNSLAQVVYGSGTFVAVGEGGTILTSPDGVSWTKRDSSTDYWVNGVVYGNEAFVAVGDGSTVLTSADGLNWTTRSPVLNNSCLNSITFGNGTFVAVGSDGTIITSPDGSSWTSRYSGLQLWLSGVTYSDGIFIAVGSSGAVLTSPDGINWTPGNPLTNSVSEVVYGNGAFVTVGKDGLILTSPDGINWTSRVSGTAHDLYGITYSNSTFVTVGESGAVLTSTDGISWASRASAVSVDLEGIAFGGDKFVAVGKYGGIIISPDGANWTGSSLGIAKYLEEIIHENGTFVAVGEEGTVLTSADGISWTGRNSGTSHWLTGAVYGNNTYVAVGDSGTILTSPDGISWTQRVSGESGWIFRAALCNGIFVAVGQSGAILTSPDGISWTARSSGVSTDIRGVTYGNGVYVAAGDDGVILTSPDGVNWTRRSNILTRRITDVAYGGGKFIAVTNYGYITSNDGINWSDSNPQVLSKVKYINGRFWGTGSYGRSNVILTSPDGISWDHADPLQFFNDLQGISYGANSFVAVGEGGTILQSYLTGLTLDSGSYSIPAGGTHSTSVTAVINGLTSDVTAVSYYSSSNPSVAAVTNTGMVTGLTPGSTVIKAVYGGIQASSNVTVPLPSAHSDNAAQPVADTGVNSGIRPDEGGKVSLGGEAGVEIPAGALNGTAAVEVRVRKVAGSPEIPSGLKLVGSVFDFSVGAGNSYRFAMPVTLTFSFDPSALGPGERLGVYYYDEEASQWAELGGMVSGSAISVKVDHFTKFTVMAVKEESKPEALSDISGHWAEKSISRMVYAGAISGYPDGSFKPDNTITRAEFASMLVKAFNLKHQEGRLFKDTERHWAKEAIATAAAHGLAGGYSFDTFGPDDPITREQMAVMTEKAAGLATPLSNGTSFKDSGDISNWAAGPVAVAVINDVIKGYPDNTFRPKAEATRAEAVAVIVRALK